VAAAARLPAWESPSAEAAARAALDAAAELPEAEQGRAGGGAAVLRCCAALAVLLADAPAAVCVGLSRPALWRAFCRRARADPALGVLHGGIEALDARVRRELAAARGRGASVVAPAEVRAV